MRWFSGKPPKIFYNLLIVKLNQTETEALSLGFKFHISKINANKIDTETQFEDLFDQMEGLHQVSEVKKGWFKSKLHHRRNFYLKIT